MNVSFGNTDGAVAVEKVVTPAVETPSTPVAASVAAPTPASQLPAVRPPSALAPSGLVLGDKLPDFRDIILPRVNIVQGIGELKDTHPVGGIVFNQNLLLFHPPQIDKTSGAIIKPALKPVTLAVLGFRPTRYVEKVEGGGRGLIVNTEDEVRANGGTLDYNEWKLKKADGIRRFEQLAEALVAIKRPDFCADDDTVFVYSVGDDKYALGLWGMKGTAFTAAAKKVFFTARALGCLRKDGYPSFHYAVSTKEEQFGTSNKCWVPVCIPSGKSNDAFMAFAREILGAPVEESAAEAAQ